MNILSLFDGLGGGRIALERAGIQVDNYYASEVDKYAITVAKHNYPDIIELGDIRKWREWDLPEIDLIIGGSPCQSFSIAGRRDGMSIAGMEITSLEQYETLKAGGVEFEGQSYLFWEYVAILRHYNPRWFLLENTRMAKKWEDIISQSVGINPVMINSALVSAQNRNRLYWTNICVKSDLFGNLHNDIPQPEDRHIMLTDVLEDDACEPMYSNIHGGFGEKQPRRHYGKSVTITANSGGGAIPSVTQKKAGIQSFERHEWDSVDDNHIRELTVLECERLQTLPDGYTAAPGVSNSQRYKMIGNGWTIDIIKHILSYLPQEVTL